MAEDDEDCCELAEACLAKYDRLGNNNCYCSTNTPVIMVNSMLYIDYMVFQNSRYFSRF